MKSCQAPWKVKIATVARAGLVSGRTMLHQMRVSLAPSIRAASDSSMGMLRMNWRSKKIRKAFPKKDRIHSGIMVPSIFRSLKIR